jgi:hypothetical protein
MLKERLLGKVQALVFVSGGLAMNNDGKSLHPVTQQLLGRFL